MIDESEIPGDRTGTSAIPGGPSEPRVAFCQECGRALAASTLRRVGNGVFCIPCSAPRQTSSTWQSVRGGGYPGASGARPSPMPPADPNPAVACCLGFIPGVGAMYNGQYAKGAMHLIVFVVLVTLADNLNWVFYWLVWGWVFYQAFDAYHTARARRDGLPLPNPFGWNDIGDRLGIHRTPPEPGPGNSSASTFRSAGANWAGANWAGYVPPREPASSSYAPVAGAPSQNPYTATYADSGPRPAPPLYVPYAPTYTASVPGQIAIDPSLPTGATRRFPVGALWLIGLGVIFLFGNLRPEWRLSSRWLIPLVLAAVAAWGALRRWEEVRRSRLSTAGPHSLAGAMVGPVMLFTVAVLLTFQAGHAFPLHRSWPVLLVVWGGMLLLQRTAPQPRPVPMVSQPEVVPQPVRSTSGTGSLGL